MIQTCNLLVTVVVLLRYLDPAWSLGNIPCPADKDSLFDNCVCKGEGTIISLVNCTNTFLTSDDLLQTLADKAPYVEKVIYTGNYVGELHSNIFGSCAGSTSRSMNNLTYLDLSHNFINTIHGQTFHCIPNMETLILNDNAWYVDENKMRIFSSMTHLKSLHLEDAFSEETQDTARTKTHIVNLKDIFVASIMPNLEELNLNRNQFEYINSDMFKDLPNLRRLYLSGNDLDKINLEHLGLVEELYIEDNWIPYLTPTDISNIQYNMTNLRKLALAGNKFVCTDCSRWMVNFRDWLRSPASHMVHDKDKLKCYEPEELKDKPIVNVTNGNLEGTCNDDPPFQRSHEIKIIIAMMVLLSVFVVVVIIVCINKDAIRQYDGGCWQAIRRKTRRLLTKQQIQYTYDTMTDEEMFSIDT